MATSDLIARFIMESIEESERGFAELQRGALAEMFSCVPSQINYVLSTRFSPEHGYVVESRRGGGGYIRVSRVRSSPADMVMGAVKAIGDELDMATAAAYVSNFYKSGIIDRRCAPSPPRTATEYEAAYSSICRCVCLMSDFFPSADANLCEA